MSDHSSFRATASGLFQKHGRPVTLKLKIASLAAEPWNPAPAQYLQSNVIALFYPTTIKDDKGGVVPGIFHRVYFASADAEAGLQAYLEDFIPSLTGMAFPKLTTADILGDYVEGREYQIVKINEVKPGEQSILFDMIVSG